MRSDGGVYRLGEDYQLPAPSSNPEFVQAIDDGIWQRRLLEEIGILEDPTLVVTAKDPLSDKTIKALRTTPLLCDNKATTFTASNPSTGARSKHIDVRFLKIREHVKNGDLRVVHVNTAYNVADFFTKGLAITKFAYFRELTMGDQPSGLDMKALLLRWVHA